MKKLMGIRALVASAALAAGMTFAMDAKADSVSCTPTRARAYLDRIDTRCQGLDAWFIALRSDTSEELIREMLSLLNAAVVAGKPVRLYYTQRAGDANRYLTGVEIYP